MWWMQRRRGGRRCSNRSCRVGKAKRAHHATSRPRRDGGHATLCPPYGTALDIKRQPTSRGATRPMICIFIRTRLAAAVRETRRIAAATAADMLTIGRTRPSVPTGLLHSRAHLCHFFEPALDLGAGHREILELAIVEPVQGYARGVTLVARDDSREEAVDETAQARQQNRSSPGKWPGSGGRNGGQHRHGYVLSKSSRNSVSLPAPFLSKACCQHGVSRLRRVRRKARLAPDTAA